MFDSGMKEKLLQKIIELFEGLPDKEDEKPLEAELEVKAESPLEEKKEIV